MDNPLLTNLFDYSKLTALLAQLLTQTAANTASISAFEGTFATLSHASNTMSSSLDKLNKLDVRMNDHDRVLAETQHRLTNLEYFQHQHKSDIAQLSQQLQIQQQQLHDVQKQQADMHVRIDACVVQSEILPLLPLPARITELTSSLTSLTNSVDAIDKWLNALKEENFRQKCDAEFANIKAAVNSLHQLHNDDHDTITQMQADIDERCRITHMQQQLDDFLDKMKQLETAMNGAVRGELKRFEKDVIIYVHDAIRGNASSLSSPSSSNSDASSTHTHHHHTHNTNATAAAKIKCLTCDKPSASVVGAVTFRYSKDKHIESMKDDNSGSGKHSDAIVTIEAGQSTYLHGKDGNVTYIHIHHQQSLHHATIMCTLAQCTLCY